MSAHRSTTLAITAALAVTLICDGLAIAESGGSHGSPVLRTAPSEPPVAVRKDGKPCLVTRVEQSGSAHGSVWVQPNPTSVVTIWLPGLNSQACRARRVVGNKALAVRLANGIEHAPKVTGREYACPADDGSSVDVYLTYASGSDEYVSVDLTGCRWIDAPN